MVDSYAQQSPRSALLSSLTVALAGGMGLCRILHPESTVSSRAPACHFVLSLSKGWSIDAGGALPGRSGSGQDSGLSRAGWHMLLAPRKLEAGTLLGIG